MIYEDFEYTIEPKSRCIKILKYHGNKERVFVPRYLECRLVTIIGQEAFSAPYIKEVYLPDTIEKIEKRAFANSNISVIHIFEYINEIDEAAFSLCPRLYLFGVDENNPYYTSSNGILFNKDMSYLIKYPNKRMGRKYVVPKSVTRISNNAFWLCMKLKKIVIPKSVKSLDCLAFKDCSRDLVIYIHKNCILKNQDKISLNIKRRKW